MKPGARKNANRNKVKLPTGWSDKSQAIPLVLAQFCAELSPEDTLYAASELQARSAGAAQDSLIECSFILSSLLAPDACTCSPALSIPSIYLFLPSLQPEHAMGTIWVCVAGWGLTDGS